MNFKFYIIILQKTENFCMRNVALTSNNTLKELKLTLRLIRAQNNYLKSVYTETKPVI